MIKPNCSNFRMITAVFLGVQIFQIVMVFRFLSNSCLYFRMLMIRCFTQTPSYMNKLSPTSLSILLRGLLLCFTINLEVASSDNRINWTIYLSLVMRKCVFGVCNQVRLKPACSATETSHIVLKFWIKQV